MLESFTIAEGRYAPCVYANAESWLQKADKALRYRREFGVEMWTLTTADALSPVAAAAASLDVDPRLSYAWYATAMYGFDGFGWAEPQFSASGAAANLLPWRPRPEPNAPSDSGRASWVRWYTGLTRTGVTPIWASFVWCVAAPRNGSRSLSAMGWHTPRRRRLLRLRRRKRRPCAHGAGHADGNADRDTYGDTHVDADCFGHADANAHRDTYGDTHVDADCFGHGDGNADRDTYGDTHIDADCFGYAYANAHGDSRGDTRGDTHAI